MTMYRWKASSVSGIGRHQSRLGASLPKATSKAVLKFEVYVHFHTGTVEGELLGDWCAAVKKSEKDLDFLGTDTVGHEERQGRGVIKGGGVGSRCFSTFESS